MTNMQIEPEPTRHADPRWAYPELSTEGAYRAWPCADCGTRRDEHADQKLPHRFPGLDITDHPFREGESPQMAALGIDNPSPITERETA